MIAFTGRNLKLFFRDKSAVLFSLLTSFIIIGLYVLFLGNVWTDSFENELTGVENIREMMDNWVMAGLLAVTSVTTTVGAFSIMINDRTKKIDKDFFSSPVSRSSIAGGYLISAYIIAVIISLFTFVLAEIYIVAEGGAIITIPAFIKLFGLILLASVTNTSMVFFITTLFHSQNAYSSAGTVIGTLIGFITGIYLPIGTLPDAVQVVIKIFPSSHAAVLMRQVMMNDVMETSFASVPAEYVNEFKETLGVVFKIGDDTIPVSTHILILAGYAVLFFGLAVINLSRKKK